MSILTKICVVLVLFVSVAASGVFLRIVSVQRSWRNAYNQQETRAAVADLTAANAAIALQKEVAAHAVTRGESLGHQKALTDEQTAHTADKAADARLRAVLQGNFDALKASFAKLQKDLEASHALQKQFSDEKTALAKSRDIANETARGLKKNLDEASVQIRRLSTMAQHYVLLIKDLRAEVMELREEIVVLRSQIPTVAGKVGDGDSAPVTPPGEAVSGKVTAVHDGVASINIGRAKGIKEKMKLTIYRGGKFVAHLRIDLVEPDTAAGVIIDKKLDVVQGDEVATDLE